MKKGTSIWVLHGPNLNLLGTREPDVYGHTTLAEIDRRLAKLAAEHGAQVTCKQTNREGELIDWVQAAREKAHGLLINAGGYTHTSIALGDAIRAVALPAVEVHLSNTQARDSFRHVSHIAPACIGVVAGFGARSYDHALAALIEYIGERRSA